MAFLVNFSRGASAGGGAVVVVSLIKIQSGRQEVRAGLASGFLFTDSWFPDSDLIPIFLLSLFISRLPGR
jgi:hypothetical protein